MANKSEDLELEGAQALQALEEEEMSAEDALKRAKTLQEKRAFFVQVLSRGVLNDRLNTAGVVAEDRKALWIRERDEDIQRILALGGRLETSEESGEKGLHGTADNRIRVGDVVLMSVPREDYELLQDIKQDQTRDRLTAARREAVGKMRETGLEVFDNSSSNVRRG
jgi:hypothetical protein